MIVAGAKNVINFSFPFRKNDDRKVDRVVNNIYQHEWITKCGEHGLKSDLIEKKDILYIMDLLLNKNKALQEEQVSVLFPCCIGGCVNAIPSAR